MTKTGTQRWMDDFVRLVLQSWNGHAFDRPELVVEILGTLAVFLFFTNYNQIGFIIQQWIIE